MGSKVHGFGSLYQTWENHFCYRMEELITLHHGNFAILGKWVKEYAQRGGCSNWVADWALWSQLFQDEMKKEHPGQNTTHRQEWNLFLLEWMFQNATTMQCKEHQRCSCGLSLEPPETATEHPSVQTLVGSRDSDLLWVREQIYKGDYVVAPRVFTHAQDNNLMKELAKGAFWVSDPGWPTRWKGVSWIALQKSRGATWGLEEEDQALEVRQ